MEKYSDSNQNLYFLVKRKSLNTRTWNPQPKLPLITSESVSTDNLWGLKHKDVFKIQNIFFICIGERSS